MLTQAELKELLHYDEETGIFTWKVSTGRSKVGQIAGSPSQKYIHISIKGKKYKAHRLAWLYVYGVWPIGILDHEDQVRHHNWIKNLRQVTHSENGQNRWKNRNNTSGHKGVTFHKRWKKWVARIKVQGKQIFLGNFDTPELAAQAYKQAQEKQHTHRPI
jgi:hypothetical protein